MKPVHKEAVASSNKIVARIFRESQTKAIRDNLIAQGVSEKEAEKIAKRRWLGIHKRIVKNRAVKRLVNNIRRKLRNSIKRK